MRLVASTIIVCFTLCSFVLDVLGCNNDAVSIFRRGGVEKGKAVDTGTDSKDCGPPPSHNIMRQLKKPKRRGFPRWLNMPIKKSILTRNSCVLILDGVLNKSTKKDHNAKFTDPVIKVYKDQSEKDMKFVFTEVSHLKHVEQYIDGVFEWSSDFTKMNVYILMVNMGVGLDPWNRKDVMKHSALKEPTRDRYRQDYGMTHLDSNNVANFAHVEGDDSKLTLLDWAHARYKKIPNRPKLTTFQWPKDPRYLPKPPPPIPAGIPDPVGHPEESLPLLEQFVIKNRPPLLWGNAEARYYKLHSHVNGFPAALKVSWILGIQQFQSLYQEITSLVAAGEYLEGGEMMLDETRRIAIAYLIVKFQGEMAVQGLDHEKLKKEAIERYKNEFGMVNTHLIDKYFVYHKAENKGDKDMAYIYDWSSARHVDLPDGTLDYICPEPNSMNHGILKSIETAHCSEDAAGGFNKRALGEPAHKRALGDS